MSKSSIPVEYARFTPGQLVYHTASHYRGVIFDVDAEFKAPAGQEAAPVIQKLNPQERAQPWYYLLVDGSDGLAYSPQYLLEVDKSPDRPVEHPAISYLFSGLENGRYIFRHYDN